MTISESFKVPIPAPSLGEILAALAIQSDLEEAIAQRPLTQALEQCVLFAQAHDLVDLASFVKQELDGYSRQPPSDRFVQLSYFDVGGQLLNGLSQYSSYPLLTGVRTLELHLKNGLTLKLPPQILTFLSQTAGREVDIGHVSPSEINKLLESIRDRVSQRVQN